MLQSWATGRVKQAAIARLLGLRARRPALFAHGRYMALKPEGERADHLVAFVREGDDGAVLTIATRHSAVLLEGCTTPLVGPENWAGTHLDLPEAWSGRTFQDVLGGAAATRLADRIEIADLLTRLPVAVLELH
jgi:(1->4)-alpha-D-glucan 1-alpha-D-glucosylmutase